MVKLNMPQARLTFRSAEVAWTPIMKHLLAVLHHISALHWIHIQASHALDEILIVITKASARKHFESAIQLLSISES